jgi:hypothetical protein
MVADAREEIWIDAIRFEPLSDREQLGVANRVRLTHHQSAMVRANRSRNGSTLALRRDVGNPRSNGLLRLTKLEAALLGSER